MVLLPEGRRFDVWDVWVDLGLREAFLVPLDTRTDGAERLVGHSLPCAGAIRFAHTRPRENLLLPPTALLDLPVEGRPAGHLGLHVRVRVDVDLFVPGEEVLDRIWFSDPLEARVHALPGSFIAAGLFIVVEAVDAGLDVDGLDVEVRDLLLEAPAPSFELFVVAE